MSNLSKIPTPQESVNETVVERLEHVLGLAKEGKISHVTIHAIFNNGGATIYLSSCVDIHKTAGILVDSAIERLK